MRAHDLCTFSSADWRPTTFQHQPRQILWKGQKGADLGHRRRGVRSLRKFPCLRSNRVFRQHVVMDLAISGTCLLLGGRRAPCTLGYPRSPVVCTDNCYLEIWWAKSTGLLCKLLNKMQESFMIKLFSVFKGLVLLQKLVYFEGHYDTLWCQLVDKDVELITLPYPKVSAVYL